MIIITATIVAICLIIVVEIYINNLILRICGVFVLLVASCYCSVWFGVKFTQAFTQTSSLLTIKSIVGEADEMVRNGQYQQADDYLSSVGKKVMHLGRKGDIYQLHIDSLLESRKKRDELIGAEKNSPQSPDKTKTENPKQE